MQFELTDDSVVDLATSGLPYAVFRVKHVDGKQIFADDSGIEDPATTDFLLVWYNLGGNRWCCTFRDGLVVARWFSDTGYFYCPYVPLMQTPIVLAPSQFSPLKGIMTRYGKKLLKQKNSP